MTHSFDNTLLQRMGFADPDRRTAAHEDACIKIASDPEQFLRVAAKSREVVHDPWCQRRGPCNDYSAVNGNFRTENGIVWATLSMLVEVKTKIHSIGDLLRQVNLYREYRKCDEYVVWSLDSADRRFATLLEQQGYALLVGAMP